MSTVTSAEAAELHTVGEISELTGAKPHRVLYQINSRRIEPAARVGAYRLFDAAAVERIRAGLASQRGRGRPVRQLNAVAS